MTMLRRVLLATLALWCAGLSSAAAQGYVLDLGRQAPDATTTVSVAPGRPITIVLRNRIPGAAYTVSVQQRAIDIPSLPPPTSPRSAAPESCPSFLKEADDLARLDDEIAVANS